MYTATNVTLIALGLVVAGAMTVQAQSASIDVTATVQQPITVTGPVALAFGAVFPGINKMIAATGASAGRFDVTGQTSAPVNLTLGLPTSLAQGINNLAIGSWTGYLSPTTSPAGGAAFSPVDGSIQTASLSSAALGALSVFLGATVSPAVNQAPGPYLGTVSLTVTY
jgi:hypothetical protein